MDKFLEFISNEEKIFLENQSKLQDEYAFFVILDDIYQKPIQNIDSKLDSKKDLAILLLYNLTHFNLYFSISCFLKDHLSEVLFYCRKGIDAGLSAYKIILEPNLASVYLDGKSKEYNKIFKHIKNHIKEGIKKEPDKYLLANDLIGAYEICNPYSHADILTVNLLPRQNSTFEKFYNFQFPEDDKKYKQYFVATLGAFLKIFYIFNLFFDEKFKVKDTSLENSIEDLRLKLEKESQNV